MSQNLSSAAVVIGALRVKLWHAEQFLMHLLWSTDFFQNQLLQKFFLEHYQSVKH